MRISTRISVRRSPTSRSAAALLLVGALGAGCAPSCDTACLKLVETCGGVGAERMTADECGEACVAEDDLYDRWTDTQLRAALDAELRCIVSSTCEEIEAGACYDDSLFVFAAQ